MIEGDATQTKETNPFEPQKVAVHDFNYEDVLANHRIEVEATQTNETGRPYELQEVNVHAVNFVDVLAGHMIEV